ncbi:MAG: hypothetical protein ABH896_04330 [Candidatus Jacksonbacteria bacterium]
MSTEKQNLNGILNRTFKYAKQTAKEFYFKKWAKNPPKCPAFNGEIVHITQEGWEHVVKTIRRTKMDVLGRLFVLERAKKLLEQSVAFQDYQEVTNRKYKVEYWIFYGIVYDVNIKVVVRSIKDGAKHFLSVIRKGSVEKEIKGM